MAHHERLNHGYSSSLGYDIPYHVHIPLLTLLGPAAGSRMYYHLPDCSPGEVRPRDLECHFSSPAQHRRGLSGWVVVQPECPRVEYFLSCCQVHCGNHSIFHQRLIFSSTRSIFRVQASRSSTHRFLPQQIHILVASADSVESRAEQTARTRRFPCNWLWGAYTNLVWSLDILHSHQDMEEIIKYSPDSLDCSSRRPNAYCCGTFPPSSLVVPYPSLAGRA